MENTVPILFSIGLFIALLIVIVYIRYKLGERFEVKNPDIVLALLPIIIWLLLSGKITSLQLGDLKIETAFKNAKNESITKQVSQMPITTIQGEDKSGLSRIDEIIRAKPQALKFVLGNEPYVPEIMMEYLRRLAASTVKYIVFENKNRQFIGLITLSELNSQIFNNEGAGHLTSVDLVTWLVSEDINRIKAIKGLLSVSIAITESTTREKTLALMETLNSEILPVVDGSGKLHGVVERSRVATSLLIDISKSLDQ